MDADEVSDLIIFRNRPKEEEIPKDKTQAKLQGVEVASDKQVQVQQEVPEQKAEKTEPQPMQESAKKPARQPAPQEFAPESQFTKMPLSINDSIRLAKGQFCINHQWRHAYAVCSVCKLPYCYVDIMEQGGKLYCINDIESVKVNQGEAAQQQSVNSFSIMASVLFIANSLLLAHFTSPQLSFMTGAAAKSGLSNFILHLSPSYYTPILNIAIVILGLIAAYTILRKSTLGLAFSLFISFGGLLAVLYEYLNSSVDYLFVSTILLLITLAAIAYSRMSSVSELSESRSLTPDIDWPKPEMY